MIRLAILYYTATGFISSAHPISATAPAPTTSLAGMNYIVRNIADRRTARLIMNAALRYDASADDFVPFTISLAAVIEDSVIPAFDGWSQQLDARSFTISAETRDKGHDLIYAGAGGAFALAGDAGLSEAVRVNGLFVYIRGPSDTPDADAFIEQTHPTVRPASGTFISWVSVNRTTGIVTPTTLAGHHTRMSDAGIQGALPTATTNMHKASSWPSE